MPPPSLAHTLFDQIVLAHDPVAAIRDRINSDPPTYEDDTFDCKLEPRQPDLNVRKENLKKIWSKALSGFANAAGGVLIWGLVAKNDPATKVDKVIGEDLVQDPARLEADLRKLQVEMTDPPLGGVEYRAFQSKDKPGGFVVCYVPAGPFKPYRQRSCDEQYYYRWGDSFRVMPRHMLQMMFYPRVRATFWLEVSLTWEPYFPPDSPQQRDLVKMMLEVGIANRGTATAKDVLFFMGGDPANNLPSPVQLGRAWERQSEYFRMLVPMHPGLRMSKVFSYRWEAPGSFERGSHRIRVIPSCSDLSFAFMVSAENQEPQHFNVRFDIEELTAKKRMTFTVSPEESQE